MAMGWGKHFERMYEGSMYGAGIEVFAVWGYAISRARNGVVELNSKKLADTLGGTVEQIEKAMKYLCSPDELSRWKTHEGRRLVKQTDLQYFIPSWEYYHNLRKQEDRREQNRVAQEVFRNKVKCRPGESMRQAIKRVVKEDEITKSDKRSMAVLKEREEDECPL